MSDIKLLEQFDALVTKLNATQGTIAKVAVLREHASLQPLIKRIWDPDTKTHVTKAGLETWLARHALPAPADTKLYDLMDQLTSGALSGDAARAAVWAYIARWPKYEDLILRIVEKKPRIRLGATMLQQAFPGIFQIFRVCLAQEYSEADFEKAMSKWGRAWISKKIDGMRLITILTEAGVEFYSRAGNRVTSLDQLRRDIMDTIWGELTPEERRAGYVFDGEIVALNTDGTENFKLTVSEARRKDVEMTDPHYRIFDCMSRAVFEGAVTSAPYGERLVELQEFKEFMPDSCEILEQTPWTAEAFASLKAKAKHQNWEGLMIRFDAPYEPKRTRNLLKYKFINTAEYKVLDAIIEDMPFPTARGGEERLRAVSAVVIEHKGCRVQVGSGFDKAERLAFAAAPAGIVGKIISVKYQEEFYDAVKKTSSLRCPIYQGIVGDKTRDV